MRRTIVAGRATGPVLRSAEPINFLGAVDAARGAISDPSHALHGRALRGTILAFPHGTGSSVGAYTVYALKANGVAPAAMVCARPDASVVSGCAIAGIPLMLDGGLCAGVRDGQECTVDTVALTAVPA
ncbi:MAG: DUF126 domain-containing protein [Thaumarchaeota archaeon]|nr:DUF126 domain-containing protein [Nitrososphaerota archaeon]MDD9808845.1 DUF126 domain-containing protein [Nitrososphaerota archaeon]MDD9813626.1 DUF126 domain-containing protein [Nitrososphaerota archaeon]MDD9843211.1 DUF126 domain-containing protein [Nitrososphaerota archaeon]